MVITMYKLVMVARQPGNCGIMDWLLSLYFTVARQQRTHLIHRERSGSVVECLTRDRRVAGSSLTGVTALWSLSKTHLS